MKKTLALLLILLIINHLNAQKLLVITYNVENLMDTIDDPLQNDDEFTPLAPKNWNSEKYFKKLNDIAKVLSSIDSTNFPALISLQEIENENVIKDLLKTKIFSKYDFDFIHYESNDSRGIDNALLYNKKIFSVIEKYPITLHSDIIDLTGLRDILYAKLLVKKDTLHIFVNHWKSRQGGKEKTEIMRIETAKNLRNKCDSLLKVNKNANIIIMGDFNDTPFDASLSKTLNASLDSNFTDKNQLFNLTSYAAKQGKGSIFYQEKWFLIDNVIISQALMNPKNKIYISEPAYPFAKINLNLYYNPKIDTHIPNKTYGGNTYFGGVSDHLPVYFYINFKK